MVITSFGKMDRPANPGKNTHKIFIVGFILNLNCFQYVYLSLSLIRCNFEFNNFMSAIYCIHGKLWRGIEICTIGILYMIRIQRFNWISEAKSSVSLWNVQGLVMFEYSDSFLRFFCLDLHWISDDNRKLWALS